MLSQLYIENIAVIEKAQIEFDTGFNVLTGETGAGKSILIDSINAVLGGRTQRDLIRAGAPYACVTAVFDGLTEETVAKLEELGYSAEDDGTLMVRREIRDTKSPCRINGRPATVSILKEIGPTLVNIHGQHESYSLLSPNLHIKYLDSMGIPDDLTSGYIDAFENMRRAKKDYESLNLDEEQKTRQIDLLSYQINELEDAALQPGEEDELNRQRTMYGNSEKITRSIISAKEALDGDDETEGAASTVSSAAEDLEDAAKYMPQLSQLAERLRNISYDLEDCGEELRGYDSELEYDPHELDEIEARLDTIYRLGLKYGSSTEKMLEYLENSKKRLEQIQLSGEAAKKAKNEYDKYKALAQNLAGKISNWRLKAAKVFTQKVKNELEFLEMPNVKFEISREECPLNLLGCDKIEFLISTNAGEPAKPIAKIASGGELSRIMLAIKTVLAGRDNVGTLIFDEVDTGVSGSAAQKIGLKLKEVSKNRQVVCVTHLAQIAALADTQYLISKSVKNGKTYTKVDKLDYDGRRRELARIIGGAEITQLTLENAAEMLKFAQKE